MDNDINSPNSLWSTLKEGIIYVIKSETSSIDAILNLIFGVLAILFVFACSTTSIVETLLQSWKPELNLGISPIYIVVMFFGTLIYFSKCIKFVNSQKKMEEKIHKIKKVG